LITKKRERKRKREKEREREGEREKEKNHCFNFFGDFDDLNEKLLLTSFLKGICNL